MPGALGDIIDAVQTGLGQIPPAVLVVGLLFGPTLVWIILRLYASPRSSTAPADTGDLFWICPECRSANDVGRQRCYHCQTDRSEIEGALRVVDRDQVLELDDAPVSPGIAVGPGRSAVEGPTPIPISAHRDPVQEHHAEGLGNRPLVAVPIEPELDDDEDDVMAASQSVRQPPARRRRRTTKRDGGD